ncbi:MAG: hypothetical protein R2708_10300 [Vicinamibacterales bacterium]
MRRLTVVVQTVSPLWLVLAAHAAVTWAMTGLIWFVQVVHYPLFAAVDASAFPAYHAAHTRLTTLVVAPLMLTEAALAVWLVVGQADVPWVVWTGAALLGVAWVATFGLSVPRHAWLAAHGADAGVLRTLVSTNWIRTVAWTARALLAVWTLRALVRV